MCLNKTKELKDIFQLRQVIEKKSLVDSRVISADNRRFLSFMYPTSVGVQPGPLKLSKLNTTYEF